MTAARALHTAVHKEAVFRRRIDVIARAIAAMLPADAHVLDIGCGSGTLAHTVMRLRPDVHIEGVDVLVRPDTEIPVTGYDGQTLPWPDAAFDVVMLVDVLHHTDAPEAVMAEAKRVSRGGMIIKDHFRDGLLAGPTLRFMDWFGNAQHGVRLPYNYWSSRQWREAWTELGLRPESLKEKLGLYARPFSWAFDRRLHFVARLV